ncbi:MAG: metallophosphoesterase [Bacteroidota bacterium]
MIRLLVLIAVILAIDIYTFQAIRLVCRGISFSRYIYILYWSFTVFSIAIIIASSIYDWQLWPKGFRTYSFALIFVVTFSKLFVVIFLLADDLIRLMRWLGAKLYDYFPRNEQVEIITREKPVINRYEFLVRTGLVVAAIPFISMIWGMVSGAYNYRVKKLKLTSTRIPKAFQGFRIVQISDIHTGSFIGDDALANAVKIINDQNADIVLFTGDLVNNKHEEALPHIKHLKEIKSKYGIYSTLGNHDYGDYVKWDSPKDKQKNLESLIAIHKSMGWDILLDEHRTIEHNGDRISLIGVQNWSSHLRFPKYGSMELATENIHYSAFNILMTHDPSHWRAEILNAYHEIDLTLSGHTHGMQFGIEIPGFKWSPVQYVYKEWAGLYNEGHQHLYVNRGLGFLGYPGRVGILPEITVIELHPA